MSGNSLVLVCDPCERAKAEDYGFKIAIRGVIGQYEPFGPREQAKQLSNWFRKHSKCGGSNHPDHFLLAHVGSRDYDQPIREPLTIHNGAIQ